MSIRIVSLICMFAFGLLALPDSIMAGKLLWPIDCAPGDSVCSAYIGYPDIDGDGKAYDCSSPGYSGHQGTDISLSTWDVMDAGVSVLAAEDGEVLWVFDGKYDRCPSLEEPDCQSPPNGWFVPGQSNGFRVCTNIGNYCGTNEYGCYWCFDGGNVVVIKHIGVDRVFATRYDHLRKGSILVSPGNLVSKGQKIAEVGSAGRSTGPHLHFEVWSTGFYELADPWAGKCGPNLGSSLWQSIPPWNAPSDYFDTVQKTYIGYYHRAADPGGLIYWAERLDATGGNLTEIIEAFANSAESQALYGTINSSNISNVVNGIYNALFGRDAEAGGLSYYVNGFNSGRFTAATIMLNVLYGAQNEDLQSINNKLTAANLFTRTIDPELDGSNFQVTYAGNADAIAGRDFLTPVTSSSATIPTQGQITAYISNYIADPGDPLYSGATIVGGTISNNTIWSGEVLVNSTVVVNPGVTLTIQPGTRVKFKHYRGYREPENRLYLFIRGVINAEGTAQQPIYFTSDAPDPQNGDWAMVRLISPTGQCKFIYSVFEFAFQGLNVWQADVIISHSVFRWNNYEGVYFESYSKATLEYCQIVENGYNGLAAEQFNTITMDYCDIWRNGTNGVHVDATTLEIRRSRVHNNRANGLSVSDNGTLQAYGVSIYNNPAYGIGIGQGSNMVEVSNLIFSGNGGTIGGAYTQVSSFYTAPSQVDIGFVAEQTHALGYIPSDQLLDKYLYVYPDDETRRIVRKIGQGLGLTWSVAFDGQYIWTATLQGMVYKLNPLTGQVLKQFAAPGPQPWGMTFDGQHFWIVDFAEKRISEIDPANGQELKTFPTPDPIGGCKGVTWDGTYLNVMGWTSSKIYRMDRLGNLVGTIELDRVGAGGIAWDGSHFWVPGGKIIRYDTQGHAVGWIYPASDGTWDMAWDGQYLWATQRTNENWLDAKIYALEILKVYSP